MSRKSLFVLVVVIGAAAVAGLLALVRTSAASEQPPATGVSPQISFRLKRIDDLEARLRAKLAKASAPVAAVTASRPETVVVRQAAVAVSRARYDDDDRRESEHESEHESDGERDD